MTKINFKNNKTKTATSIISALVIGLMLLLPTTVMPNVHAQPQTLSVKTYDTSNLKAGQVMTPWGIANASQIHRFNGTTINVDAVWAKYGFPKINSHGPPFMPDVSPPTTGGWDEYGSITSTSAISFFGGDWTVPSSPTSSYNSTQVLYLFNGLQNSAGTVIIQPVLQWGNSPAYSGGNAWYLICWLVVQTGSGNQYYTSSQLSTAAGHAIYGYMQYQGGTTWLIEAQDTTSGYQTAETLATNNSFYNPVVVLESYNIPHQCSYLSGNTDFTSLSLTGSSNTNWSTANPIQWCHINAVKVSSSEIDLHTQS